MRRTLFLRLLIGVLVVAPLIDSRAQLSEEEKRNLFLKAREDIRPVPRASATPTPRPKPRPADTPPPTPRPTPKSTPEKTVEDDEPAPKPTPKASPKSTARASGRDEDEPPKKADDKEDIIPLEKSTPAPKSSPKASPKSQPAETPKPQIPKGKTPSGDKLDAPILIEKSGLQKDEGLVEAPKSTGGWFKRWKYLPASVRKSIDQAKVKKGRWKYIIVHNSGTRQGNARIFDNYHRRVRKMQNGMAYHFVIGNGSSSGDGEIEIGSRWTKQVNGGHVASDYLNNISIGICLVGDLNRDKPTKAQIAALDELIQYLRGRVGKTSGKPAIVLPHKKINPKPTDCPGDRFPYAWMSEKFGK